MSRFKPHIFFLISTILFALASPVLKFLIDEGQQLGLSHPNAISFCNVLFIGNLCAGLVTYLSYPKYSFWNESKILNTKVWILLLLSAFVAILYPSFIFIALQQTTVTNLVLISRFEGIFYALLLWIIIKQKPTKGAIISYLIITTGVLIALFSNGFMPDKPSLLLVAAAIFYAISEILSIYILKKVTLQFFLFFRNFVSAIVFFFIAIYLFGPTHFTDIFYGDLWIAIGVYAIFNILIGQLFWFRAIATSNLTYATNYALIIPLFTFFFSWLLLMEIPTFTEYLAIAFIIVGIVTERIVNKVTAKKYQILGPEGGLIGR